MSDQAVRDLLDAAASEPPRPLDGEALLRGARRRRARNRTALTTSLLLTVALVALPVVVWPDLPDGPDVGRLLPDSDDTAPELTGRYPASAVGSGQSPAEPGSQAVELAGAELPDGRRLVYVAYRDTSGQYCTGFVGSSGLGLPSGCHPRRSIADDDGLVFGVLGEQDAQHRFNSTIYVWGSAPADTAYVRLVGSNSTQDYPVTTSDHDRYDDRTYFVAVLEAGPVIGGSAHNERDELIAERKAPIAGSDTEKLYGYACGIRPDPGVDSYGTGLRAVPGYIGLTLEEARAKAAAADAVLRVDGDAENGCRKQPAPPPAGSLVRVFLSEGRVVVAAKRDE